MRRVQGFGGVEVVGAVGFLGAPKPYILKPKPWGLGFRVYILHPNSRLVCRVSVEAVCSSGRIYPQPANAFGVSGLI